MRKTRSFQPSSSVRCGFTLVEILVVLIILGMLFAALLPAVQKVREAARRSNCGSNLHQIGIAMAAYESSHGHYPTSWKPTPADSNGRINGWSVWAIILPYLDQGNVYSNLNFEQGYSSSPTITAADGSTIKINALRIPTYLCPSEIRDEARLDSAGNPSNYPNNYGVNLGTWFIYNPATGEGGPGAFSPARNFRDADFRDGKGFTLCASEVKAWQPSVRDAGLIGALNTPATAADVTALAGTFNPANGHTEWVDGRCGHSGFTTTFRPNAKVLYTNATSGEVYDIDWINQREGTSTDRITYGAITSRSYHDGVVNTLMMDTSVRTFNNDIDGNVWRALSTRSSGEIIPSKYQTP